MFDIFLRKSLYLNAISTIILIGILLSTEKS